jgi:2-(1,2-epoxy-1,2-dihydrophenyl)acetyl-CoA isomerase
MNPRIETLDDGIRRLWIGPAGGVPAINLDTATAFRDAVRVLSGDPAVKVVILASEGKLFCAGGDIRAMHAAGAQRPTVLAGIIDAIHEAAHALRALPVPVITAVHGSAAGAGFSLAMNGDVVIAAEDAKFVTGYAGLATTSDGGLSHFLLGRLSAQQALDLLLARGPLTAAEAQALGLVLKVVPAAALQDEALAYAQRLAEHPQQVLAGFKALLNGPDLAALKAQLDRERERFLANAGTALFGERLEAFLTRR